MEERRKFPRFSLGVQVQWKKIASAPERTAQHISYANNLSIGGVCLPLHPSVANGDILQLEIKIPGKSGILTKAKVVWIDQNSKVKGWAHTVCEGGIEFLDLTEETRRILGQHVDNNVDGGSHK